MPKVEPFPHSSKAPEPERDGELSVAALSAIRTLVKGLSPQDKERVLKEITDMLRPIPAPRAGDVLGTIIKLIPRNGQQWSVAELKQRVEESGVYASPKEVYNAVGYLARRGHIQRIGPGRYVINGVTVVTGDDLGGQPSNTEGGPDD